MPWAEREASSRTRGVGPGHRRGRAGRGAEWRPVGGRGSGPRGPRPPAQRRQGRDRGADLGPHAGHAGTGGSAPGRRLAWGVLWSLDGPCCVWAACDSCGVLGFVVVAAAAAGRFPRVSGPPPVDFLYGFFSHWLAFPASLARVFYVLRELAALGTRCPSSMFRLGRGQMPRVCVGWAPCAPDSDSPCSPGKGRCRGARSSCGGDLVSCDLLSDCTLLIIIVVVIVMIVIYYYRSGMVQAFKALSSCVCTSPRPVRISGIRLISVGPFVCLCVDTMLIFIILMALKKMLVSWKVSRHSLFKKTIFGVCFRHIMNSRVIFTFWKVG